MREIRGTRVLIVEDQPIIALALADSLTEMGAVVAGAASSIGEALKLASTIEADVAVLDLWLGDALAYPVGDILHQRGIPFVVISGAARAEEPATVRDAPRLIKPFMADELLAALRSL